MGFLASMGMRAEQRRISVAFRPDEHFLETDVMLLMSLRDHETGFKAPGGNVVVSFTSHAVYVRPAKGGGFELTRLPYENIVDVIQKGPLLELLTSHKSWLFQEIGRAMGGNKYDLVVDGIQRVENVRRTVEVPGGEVLAVHRPYGEGENGRWRFISSEDLDFNDDVKRSLAAALSQEIERYGGFFDPLEPTSASARPYWHVSE